MTTSQATQQAIVAAVRAFVERVEIAASASPAVDYPCFREMVQAMYAELAALERAAQAEGAPEGGSQETNAHE